MPRIRYLVRMSNERGFTPPDWRALNTNANQALQGIKASAGAIRVGTKVIGLHLFIESEDRLNDALAALGNVIGKVIEHRQLDLPSEPKPKETMVQEAKALFNDERYWECHELLEKVWMEVGGKETLNNEAKMLQGMILVAAAFVHHQRAQDETGLSLLHRAAKKLDLWTDDDYLCMSIKSVKENLRSILEKGEMVNFIVG